MWGICLLLSSTVVPCDQTGLGLASRSTIDPRFDVGRALGCILSWVAGAERVARIVSGEITERAELAPVEVVQGTVRATPKRDPRAVSLQEKQALLKQYNDMMGKQSGQIVSTRARYADSFKEVTVANSEGTWITEERPDVALILVATVPAGGAFQRPEDTLIRAHMSEPLTGTEAEVMEYIVKPDSPATKGMVADIEFPKEAIIGGVIRGKNAFIVHGESLIKPYDRVIVFALPGVIHSIGRFFN